MTQVLYIVVKEPIQKSLFSLLCSQMPSAIQRKINSFRKWEDRQASLLGRVLLRQSLCASGLSERLLTQIEYGKFGKPYLADGPHFNITHSYPYIICAVDQQNEVGIDVETIRDIDIEDFLEQFTALEAEALALTANPISLFYSLWCKKEAIVKAQGSGLNIPLNELDVLSDKTLYAGDVYFFKQIHIDASSICWMASTQPFKQINIQPICIDELNIE